MKTVTIEIEDPIALVIGILKIFEEVMAKIGENETLEVDWGYLRHWDCPPFCVNSIIACPQIKSRAGCKLKANP